MHKQTVGLLLLLPLLVAHLCAASGQLFVERRCIHFGEQLTVYFNSSSEQAPNWDWIGVFPTQLCPDTHRCYEAFVYVSAGIAEKKVLFDTHKIPLAMGSYDVRYLRKQTIFGESTLYSNTTIQVLESKSYTLELTQLRANPGDEVKVLYSCPSNHDAYDFIALFEVDSCPHAHNCYLSYLFVPPYAYSGTLVFKLPPENGKAYEFRYIFKGNTQIAKVGPLIAKRDSALTQLFGTQLRNDIAYSPFENQYMFEVPAPSINNAIVTVMVKKNDSACDSSELILRVKRGQRPLPTDNDFSEQSSASMAASFDIRYFESTTHGRWYFSVSIPSLPNNHSNQICHYMFKLVYFIKCPNDCSNRGTCNNGTCHCSEGFSTSDCSRGPITFSPPNAPYRPLLLIPGFGGTTLAYDATGQGTAAHAWLSIDNIITGWKYSRNKMFVEALIGRYNASTNNVDEFYPGARIQVPELDAGLRAIACLLDDRARWWIEEFSSIKKKLDDAFYFEDLIKWLIDYVGYQRGETLFGFGYDFRQSNMNKLTMVRLLSKLEYIFNLTGRKIDVVCHSMGGLVFKSLLVTYPHASKYVNTWTTIATPHQGSPKANMGLMGVNYENPLVSPSDTVAFATDTASIYELQVDPFFYNEKSRVPKLKIKINDTTFSLPLFNSSHMVEQILDEFVFIDLKGRSVKRPFRNEILVEARKNRLAWRNLALGNSIRLFNLYSDTEPTPFDLSFEHYRFKKASEALTAQPLIGYAAGDGTVSVESAFSDGFERTRRIPIPHVNHFRIVKDERTVKWMRDISMLQCPLEGWWNDETRTITPTFRVRQVGRVVFFSAYMNHYWRHFQGTYEGGEVFGGVMETNETFYMNVSLNCLTMNMEIQNPNQKQLLKVNRIVGSSCFPNSGVPCFVEHGKGLQRCYYGYWSMLCEITSCNPGYCPREDATFARFESCIPCKGGEEALLCPEERPFRCHSGKCVSNADYCIKSTTNELRKFEHAILTSNITFQCLAGKSTFNNGDECLRGASVCPSSKPFLCDDLNCAETLQQCYQQTGVVFSTSIRDIRKDKCPINKPYLCASGICTTNRDVCCTEIISDFPFLFNGSISRATFFWIEPQTSRLSLLLRGNVTGYVKRDKLPSPFEFEEKFTATHSIIFNGHPKGVFIGIFNEDPSETAHCQLHAVREIGISGRIPAIFSWVYYWYWYLILPLVSCLVVLMIANLQERNRVHEHGYNEIE